MSGVIPKKDHFSIFILGVKYEPIQCLGGSKIGEECAKLVWEFFLIDFLVESLCRGFFVTKTAI